MANSVDPLIQQMSSILSLQRADRSSSSRVRRFSDTSRASEWSLSNEASSSSSFDRSTANSTRPDPVGNSHTEGLGKSTTASSSTHFTPDIQPHACERAICAVVQVFATTELLDCILDSLNTRSILDSRLVNRSWNATICESPKLRLHFFAFRQWARPGAELQLLQLRIPGLDIMLDEPIHLGQKLRVHMTLDAAKRIVPVPKPRVRSRSIFEGIRGGLGRDKSKGDDHWPRSSLAINNSGPLRLEDLLVTQPPIASMQAFVAPTLYKPKLYSVVGYPVFHDNWTEDTGPAVCAKLYCDGGVTLGFLAETTHSLLKDNDEGAVVIYKAIMSFCPASETPRRRTALRTVLRVGAE